MSNEIMENNTDKNMEKPSLFGMIMNPREQFERIRENPKIIVALLIVTALMIVGMLLTLKGADLFSEEELIGMSEEELMLFTLVTQITFIVIGIFAPIFGILISTVIYFIVAKIAQADVTFKQLFSLMTYISILGAISIIINGLVYIAVGGGNPEVLFTSLNSIVEAEGVLGALFASIEVFSIWSMILTAMGLQVVAKFSKGLSWGVVIAFSIIGVAFSMMAAGIGSAFGV